MQPDLPQWRRLLEVIARLRGEGGCPWDREQTEASMARHLLEEAHEATEALRVGESHSEVEELGDVLMNVVMIAQIASEAKRYDIESVAAGIADKLVRRHPHVFGDMVVEGTQQVLQNWEAIKREEKAGQGEPSGLLTGLPKSLPALAKALRIGEKAARVGFDWPDRTGPRAKIDEELAELDRAVASAEQRAIQDELGDLLFSIVQLARHCDVDPDLALRGTIDKFMARFAQMEQALGDRLSSASLAEKESLWQRSKQA